jgi:hypothetical protein
MAQSKALSLPSGRLLASWACTSLSGVEVRNANAFPVLDGTSVPVLAESSIRAHSSHVV